jgi:hypothetical protein
MMFATRVATKIIGDTPFQERDEDTRDADPVVVYPRVQYSDRAKEMISTGTPQPQKRPEKPKPLKGSIAERMQRR